MLTLINIFIALAVIAVVGILLFGVITMARGGEGSKEKANKIMRWRVGVQALAIVAIVIGFMIKSKMRGG